MPSASRHPTRLLALGACAALLAGVGSGCSTTQEKAEAQRAKAQRILEARKQRQAHGGSKQAADRKGSANQ